MRPNRCLELPNQALDLQQKPCVWQLCLVLRDEAWLTLLAAFERPPLKCRPLHQAVLRLDKR